MNIINFQDKKYPELLKQIGKTAPKQLYYKGNYDDDIFRNCLAVVGSRRITTYGKQVVERIVGEAAAAGITIVSGFMYGVDAAAHRAALSVSKGRTIAVMPCGIDLIHPEYQQDLYVEILNNNGLVISEYEGDMQPAHWTYPQRNRIVAGLSKATLVIEAGEKSGSLITARLAKKFGRNVFVVPGPITSENSKGIMQLIREGATPISSAQDILGWLNYGPLKLSSNKLVGTKFQRTGFQRTDVLEQKILEHLQREPLDIDTISRDFEVAAAELGTTLSLMELRGQVKQEGGKYYVN